MTAAAVAQRLGLSEAAVAAFSGTGAEFAQFFGKSLSEGEAAVADLAPPPAAPTGVTATVVDVDEVNVGFDSLPGNAQQVIIISVPAIALTYDDQDLTPPVNVQGSFATGSPYAFQMRVVTPGGTSPLSVVSSQVTPNP